MCSNFTLLSIYKQIVNIKTLLMAVFLRKYISLLFREFPTATFKDVFNPFWPLFLSLAANRFIGQINVAFAGRVRTAAMEIVGTSHGLLTVTAIGLGSGLAASFETMAAKAYGAGDYHTVGILLQKALIFSGIFCLFVTSILIHVGGILKLIGIPSQIAEEEELYLILNIPSIFAFVFYRLIRGYLMVQKIVIPLLIIVVVGAALSIPLNFFIIYLINLKITGIALATDISYITTAVLLVTYILINGVYKQTWPGFTSKCFIDWKSYIKLAIPGPFSFLLKSGVHEVALVGIGTIGEIEVATQAAVFTIMKIGLTLPFAIGYPLNIIIAKSLGEGNGGKAREAAIVGSLFNLLVTLIFTMCIVGLKDYMGPIFSNDKAVQIVISKVSLYAALSYVFESVTTVFFIISLSLGVQFQSVLIFVVSSYGIGLPLGVTLALHWKDISLVWCGLTVGFLIQLATFSALFYWKIDFESISEEALQSNLKAKNRKNYPRYTTIKTDDKSELKGDEFETDGSGYNLDNEVAMKTGLNDRKDKAEVTLPSIGKCCLILAIASIMLVLSTVIKMKIS